MEETRAKPDRTLLGILAVIAVLVVVAVVVVFTNAGPKLREPGTPERTVQDYVAAVIDGDHDAAGELLSPAWKEDCQGYVSDTSNLRITLVRTDVRSDTATVTVSMAYGGDSGPFGGSGYEYQDAFQLERTGGDWLIVSPPPDIAVCPGPGRS